MTTPDWLNPPPPVVSTAPFPRSIVERDTSFRMYQNRSKWWDAIRLVTQWAASPPTGTSQVQMVGWEMPERQFVRSSAPDTAFEPHSFGLMIGKLSAKPMAGISMVPFGRITRIIRL